MIDTVRQRQQELIVLCEQNPRFIPIEAVAEYMGMDKDCLRESIDQGKCRFGIGGKNGLRGNRFAKIPTLAFWNWVTMGQNLEEAGEKRCV